MTPRIVDFRSCFNTAPGQTASECFAATMSRHLDKIGSDPSVCSVLSEPIIEQVFNNESSTSYKCCEVLFSHINRSSNLNLKIALLRCIDSIMPARHILSTTNWYLYRSQSLESEDRLTEAMVAIDQGLDIVDGNQSFKAQKG
jgi:hypothetical protein